ncbi:MAG: response regulator transcription factor [SAR324 cluster bacterium]|uniref:Response regulator transcription factor n=1 Tax=SAR324 cluster bacterium TaxID=2024889 RepID=A0A7X9FS33_9DELT|nr:response regulator transcription factor [SAR324 cluster bacterium]
MHTEKNQNILIIEDDPNISKLIQLQMKDHGFLVDIAGNGNDGYQKGRSGNYILIILDIMLPGLDGLEICKRLRAEKIFIPILILTSRTEEIDKILGLEVGADDYLCKPFSVRELVARVKALCRRISDWGALPEASVKEEITLGALHINTAKRRVIVNGCEIALTAKEFELLTLLASSPGRVYTREQLLGLIWNYDSIAYEHTVTSHINRLRSKIEKDASKPKFILTEWGVGYKFNDIW